MALRHGAIALVGMVFALLGPTASAKEARHDLAAQCAKLAAFPAKPGVGMEFDKLDPLAAISACEAAMRAKANDPATQANLARALTKANRHEEALPLMRHAAAAGNMQALRALSIAYENGKGVEKNDAESFRFALLGEHSRYGPVLARLAWMYRDGTGTAVDVIKGRVLLERAAAAGYGQAATNLGYDYAHGTHGLPLDIRRAMRWHTRGAELGSSNSAYWVAALYEGFGGHPIDNVQARNWYMRAADMGDADAFNRLVYLLRTGTGGAVDIEQARAVIEQGIAHDMTAAITMKAWMLADGWGGVRNVEQAAALFRKAADRDDLSAMASLGSFYMSGNGVPRDDAMALEWLEKAAGRGNAYAMGRLGDLFRSGRGAETDVKMDRSLHWYRKAAEAGDTRSMNEIVRYYGNGWGTAIDPVEAVKWVREIGKSDDANTVIGAADIFVAGEDVAPDLLAAQQLYERALSQGATRAKRPLVEVMLARDIAAERGKVRDILAKAAEAHEGWAMAALAYPGDVLARVEGIDTARWRAAINAERDPNVLLEVAETLRRGRLSKQDFGLAQRYASAQPDPLAQKRFVLNLMRDLKLTDAAIRMFDAYVQTPEFSAQPKEKRAAFVNDFEFTMPYYSQDLESIPMLQRMADRGMIQPAAALGVALFYSRKDHVGGRRWLEGASIKGVGIATRKLGDIAMWGQDGRRSDPATALTLWAKAYEQGDDFAAYQIARYHGGAYKVDGKATPIDMAQLFRWLKVVAIGNFPAQTWLGRLYLSGKGGVYDPVEGIRLLKAMIHCDENGARVALARAYLDGTGVARNVQKARRWFELAAALHEDDSVAAEFMVRAAAFGWGAPADVTLARRWMVEALRRDSDRAKGWSAACGPKATLRCLIRQDGFTIEPSGPETASAKPEPTVVQEEETLRVEAERQATGGAGMRAWDAYRALSEHYLLYGDKARFLSTTMEALAVEDSRQARVFGSSDNYFALLSTSCSWAKASRQANAAGMTEAALFFAKVAVNKLQDARRKIAELDPTLHECFLKAHQDRYRYLADLFMSMGRFGEAEQVLAMLKDFEHFTYTRRAARVGKSLDAMPLDTAQMANVAATEHATRALTEASHARERLMHLRREATLTSQQQQELDIAQAALAASNTAFRSEIDGLSASLVALADTGMAKRQQLGAVKPRLMEGIRRLGPDTAALHAVVMEDRVTWLLTTPGWQRSIVVPVDIITLRKAIGAFRAALQDDTGDAVKPGRALYNMMFAPVDAALREARARHVMLSLDDSLRYVPFAALHDGKDWLVRRYAFSSFGSVDEVMQMAGGDAWHRVAGLGASQGGAGFEPLPSVAQELAAIIQTDGAVPTSGALPGVIRLDKQFDRTALADAMGGDYSVIHIASHFALDPASSAKSVLLLGDGSTLPLSDFAQDGSFTASGLSLLVLSACETAVPQEKAGGSEVESSLAELALNAGAASVMASLWSVADGSTSNLMQQFYVSARGGADKAEALRHAQIALLDRPTRAGEQDYRHPFFWAPFTLIGSWR